MRRTLATCAIALWAAAPAAADDDCMAPLADWRPKAEVAALAAAQGWSVRRITIDDGCYEIDGADAAGRRIEVSVDPATLAIVEIEYEDDPEEKRHD